MILLGDKLDISPESENREAGLRLRTDLHLVRKIWHMGTGLIGLALFYQLEATHLAAAKVMMVIALLGFTMEISRLKIEAVNRIVISVMKPFMRDTERDSMSGFPFYALGASISLFLYKPDIAILSILFLIFSDPICSLVGILYGKDKILTNKSLQGTVAGFIVCYSISFIYLFNSIGPKVEVIIFATFAGIIGTVSELVSTKLDDNLTIPVLSGLGLSFIHLLVPVFS